MTCDHEANQPSIEDIAAAGEQRKRDEERARESSARLRELVLEALREGRHRPTDVVKASGWTGAYVRKIARAAGIEPDERYRDRAARMRKQTDDSDG